jgi:hypothetical protein
VDISVHSEERGDERDEFQSFSDGKCFPLQSSFNILRNVCNQGMHKCPNNKSRIKVLSTYRSDLRLKSSFPK